MPALLAALSAGLLILAFPKPDLGWLAFVALVPLLLAIRGRTPARAFFLGSLAGWLFYMVSISWVTHSMMVYGGVPFALSALALIILAAYLSLYIGLFAMGTAWMAGAPWPLNILGPSALWVGLEYLRAYALTGLPWILLGYTQYRHSVLLPIASVAGVYGLSFVIALINITLIQMVGVAPARLRTIVLTGAVALCLIWSPKLLSPSPASAGAEQTLGVALVQGNIDQGLKWDPTMQATTIERYRSLSLEAAKHTPTLIVWPETAAPFFLRYEPALRDRILDIAAETGSYLLVGSPDAEPAAAADGGTRYRNSAFLISPKRELLGKYDKIHMVPFGEYVPLKSVLFFINKLAYGIGDFEGGRTYTVFDTPGGRFAVTICYEAIFPDQVRRYVKEGAEFLVNITNDAWFGRSAAPTQHLAMAVLRAAENRRYLVRAANTGISAIVDPSGRILHASDLFVPTVITDQIRVERAQTFYTRYGDLFAWICVIFTVVVFMATWARSAVRITPVSAVASQRRMQ
ncbi:apolipoprotein N-acyltransferase [Candidatus Methylomirabilis sp.]|uniref:apolipoprotein N-acyltransferase n=1 Tax=Candidatus Methylomirabilis sp. TaxID=2032687 RepID=UPI002A5E7478|nr:apolipoprotein N-acyltransferase [Candidatus Methylomirabilis sp.]